MVLIILMLAGAGTAILSGQNAMVPQSKHAMPTANPTQTSSSVAVDAFSRYMAGVNEVKARQCVLHSENATVSNGSEAALHVFDGFAAEQSCLHGLSPRKRADRQPPLFTAGAAEDGLTHYLNLKVLVLFYRNTYEGGFTDGQIVSMKQGIENAREFYWRNSHLKINLELHYLDIWTYRAETDFDDCGMKLAVVAADMIANGVSRNQYDGAFGNFKGKGGYFSYGTLLAMGKTIYSSTAGGCSMWTFLHEFHHQIEYAFYCCGYDYLAVHPNFRGDYGGNFELNAYILRMWPPLYWLSLDDRWGEVKTAVDGDGDGVPDNAPELPLDESRTGSSPDSVDTDGDGLTDLDEVMAGIFSGSGPLHVDTDSDGMVDGGDVYPLYKLVHYIPKYTPSIDGAIEAGWNHAGQFTVSGQSIDLYDAWDNGALYLALSFPQNGMPFSVTVDIDANNDGWRWGPDGPEGTDTVPDNYQLTLDTATGTVVLAHTRYPEVYIWNHGIEWCESLVQEGDINCKVNTVSHASLELAIPMNEAAYLIPGVDKVVGIKIYFNDYELYGLFEGDTFVDFTMADTIPPDIESPSMVQLLEPKDGETVITSEPVQFNWTDAVDYGSSGLCGYDFMIDNNLTFESPEHRYECCAKPLPDQLRMSEGIWFWRVRARDAIGNSSRYCPTRVLSSRPPTPPPIPTWDPSIPTPTPALSGFARTFGGSGNEIVSSIHQTSDGGYIMAGSTASYGAGRDDVLIVKLDSSGNQIWASTFGGQSDDRAYAIQQTTDGGYITAGYTHSYSFDINDADFLVLKLDSSGNQTWARTFGGFDGDYGFSIQQTADGGYVTAGYTWRYDGWGQDVLVVKLDSSGNQIWTRTFGGQSTDTLSAIQQTADGGYIAAGYTTSYGVGVEDALVMKLDSSGNQAWARTFSRQSDDSYRYDWADTIQQTVDGDYIMAGHTESCSYDDGYSLSTTASAVLVTKLDSSGEQAWARTFGRESDDSDPSDYAYTIQQTADGGYITAGYTYTYGEGKSDCLIMKLDSSGDISDCAPLQDVSLVATSPLLVASEPVLISSSPVIIGRSPSITSSSWVVPSEEICLDTTSIVAPTSTPRPTDTVNPWDTATPTPTRAPANYFELRVIGKVFHAGDTLELQWEADPARRFNLMGRAVAIYFGAAEGASVTDRPATVSEILSSRSLQLFNSKSQPQPYNPRKLAPTYPYVIFPLNGTDTSGSVSFNLPSGIEGTQWVFFAACVDVATGQFVSLAYPVEVSNEARVR
ncbi:MAG: hypothetical protein NTZ78_02780 [Candidatus Aureabacteria bacterium]|nr:hypothetical protein [Candidatus Auribacterota bacterium]